MPLRGCIAKAESQHPKRVSRSLRVAKPRAGTTQLESLMRCQLRLQSICDDSSHIIRTWGLPWNVLQPGLVGTADARAAKMLATCSCQGPADLPRTSDTAKDQQMTLLPRTAEPPNSRREQQPVLCKGLLLASADPNGFPSALLIVIGVGLATIPR